MKKASEIISEGLMPRKGTDPFFLTGELERIWSSIGAPFKDDFRILQLSDRTLIIGGSNSLYLYHLKQLRKDLIRAFNKELGQELIEKIKLKITGKTKDAENPDPYADGFLEFRKTFSIPEHVEKEICGIVSDNPDEQLKKRIKSYLRNAYIYERFRHEDR